MFFQIFQTTFIATLQVLLMGACGYVLVRKKIIGEAGVEQVSRLVVNFLLPLFSFHHLMKHFTFEKYSNWWMFPFLSIAVAAVAYFIANMLCVSSRKIDHKNEFLALVTFQNSGYIPLMIVTALFTGAVLHKLYVYIFLFTLGFNLLIWSFGVWLLIKDRSSRIDFNKILNPPFVSIVATLILIYFGLHKLIPGIILKPVKMFGDCALPLSMLVVGGNLARINLSDINRKEIAIFISTKLIFLPVLALAIVLFFKLEFCMGFLLVLETAVPSAVTLSLVARYYQAEDKFLSQGLFFGHLVSVISIPFFLTFYMKLSSIF